MQFNYDNNIKPDIWGLAILYFFSGNHIALAIFCAVMTFITFAIGGAPGPDDPDED